MPGRLRVGVMCHGTAFRAWEAAALSALFAVDDVEPAVLVVDGSRRDTRTRRYSSVWDAFYYRWVERRSRALARVDLSSKLGLLPVRRCVVERHGAFDRFKDDDLAALRDLELDVLVRFAFGRLGGDVVNVPRYGIWSYRHVDERCNGSGPPFYREVLTRSPTVEVTLERLSSESDAAVVLHRGTLKASGHSYLKTLDTALLGCAPWLARAARETLVGAINADAVQATTYDTQVRYSPRNAEAIAFLVRQAGRQLAHATRGLVRHPVWEVGQLDGLPQQLLAEPAPAVRWVRPRKPRSAYLADPFPHRDGALVELYDYRKGIGRIQRLMPGDGVWDLEPELPVDGHASYPFVARDGAAIYLTPQLYGRQGVQLFRYGSNGWEDLGTVVPEVAACDPTLVAWMGVWYVLFTDARQGRNSHLHCWFASELTGPWIPHPLNPVKTDIASARPAGAPFVHEGALYRPGQDCSTTYGARVVLNRVEVLDPKRFGETPVRYIGPLDARHPDGVHTLSSNGITTWVDGCRECFVPSAFGRGLMERIRRLRRSPARMQRGIHR